MDVNDLKQHYKVKTGRDLADKIGKSEGLMTIWKDNGIPYNEQCVFYYESKHKLKPNKESKP